MKISFLMLTWERYDLTVKTWATNIGNAMNESGNHQFEFLVCDQGSKDPRIAEFFKPRVEYFRHNSTNEGVSHAFNQLYLRSTGDLIVLLGNDLVLPQGWLTEAIKYMNAVPQAGIMGFDWGHGQMPSIATKFEIHARWLTPVHDRVFGSWVLKRSLIEDLGFFYEGFDRYSLEDSEFNERVNRAGYNSFYHPTLKSEHVGVGVHDSGEYRKFKDEQLRVNLAVFSERIKYFNETKDYKTPLPQKRNPL